MKTRVMYILLVVVLLLSGGCQPIQAPATAVQPTAEAAPAPATTAAVGSAFEKEVAKHVDKLNSEALAGNLYGDPTERMLYVLLPADYEQSAKRYPVLYVLPWGEGEASPPAGSFLIAIKRLLRSEEATEMIVVVPNGQTAMGMGSFRSSPVLGDYETYLTQEVVGFIDANYRTLANRDSRGIAGCANGGDAAVRQAFRHPDIFSAAAATGGIYDEALDVWPGDVEYVQSMTKLPAVIGDWEPYSGENWYYYAAAESAPDVNSPPFYSELPIRIVDGHGEFVPEVIDKIVANDVSHAARQYLDQPMRLNGLLILQGMLDEDPQLIPPAQRFAKLLTELGIEHEYKEVLSGRCVAGWESDFLKFMNDKLVFEE